MSDEAPLKPRDSERAAPAPARVWLFRALAAVGVPAALFLGFEGALRIAGVGQPVRFLVPDEKPGFVRSNPDFVGSFLPSTFDLRPLNFRVAAHKPPNTVRIVLLGESAAQGIPVPAFAFAPQLRALLRARYPGREFEVINTGIVAINSHVVYQIAREMAAYSPDLFVVYMGNNEVVGPYGPGCAYMSEMPPLWVIRMSVFVRSTRTGQLVAALVGRLARRSSPQAEWGGMSMFVNNAVRGDDPRLEAVYRNFEANLGDIARLASRCGAKTLLCTVASNLKDCAPFLSLHREGLAGPELDAWRSSFERGRVEWLLGDADLARSDLLEALRIDPQYADTLFMLGSLDLQAGNTEAARARLIDAEHWDALRFRPDPRINEIIRRVARGADASVSLLDAAVLMGSDPSASAALSGRDLFFEHVHLDWNGNYLLARSMAEKAEEALYGAKVGGPPWLDSAGCAAALSYTAHERYTVLQKIATVVENPPFTNQLTYCEDEARLARDLAGAKAAANDPGNLRLAKDAALQACARDRENADLPKIEEGVDDDLGDVAGALADAGRSAQLQPRSFALATDEAIKLSRLGRYAEAEKLLGGAAASASPRDLAAMAPAYADLFTRTRRFEEGRRYLDREISLRPSDLSLRLVRGRLAEFAGDTASAEGEFRSILSADPGDQAALENLVNLLNESGRQAEAEKESLWAVDHQPRNLGNNLRSAIICATHGDDVQQVRCLLAAERCGPVSSGVEVQIAKRLFAKGHLEEALSHLAEARRVSLYEGDPSMTESIGRAIVNLRSQMR